MLESVNNTRVNCVQDVKYRGVCMDVMYIMYIIYQTILTWCVVPGRLLPCYVGKGAGKTI